jgi:signal transduction histidine kinase
VTGGDIAWTIGFALLGGAIAWLVIARKRDHETARREADGLQRSQRRTSLLAEAGTVIGSTLDEPVLLQRVSELAVPRLGQWCAIHLRDAATGTIRCVALHHPDPVKAANARRYFAAQPIDPAAPYGVGRVIRTGAPELAADISEAELRAVARDDEGVRVRQELGHGCAITVPLRAGSAVTGAMVFGHAVREALGQDELTLAEDLAHRVALAIHNARLYREASDARQKAEWARWQATLLADASRVLAASLDYDAALDAILRLTVPTFADWAVAHIVRRDGGFRRVGPAYADPALAKLAEDLRRSALQLDDVGAVVRALGSGRPILLPDITRESLETYVPDPSYRDLVVRLGPKAAMVVPIVARGRTLGSMTFVSLQSSRGYGEDDLTFAEDLGRRAGVAVDNARLYRQMERARAQADQANRAKDEFLAVLSHELRTPLNAIAGWLKMLEAGTLPAAETERAVATVGRNVGVLRRLIEDLLDVSGIIAGKLTVERVPFSLTTIVEQAIESIEREAAARRIRVEVERETPVIVDADPVRLRQVVDNLVTNAVKFTPEQGIVTVTLRRLAGRAVLSVRDTGIGIPATVLPYVFERFRQGDGDTGRRHGGLGLGLAIVKHIVELHGGTVRAESSGEGKGATFTVDLPLV